MKSYNLTKLVARAPALFVACAKVEIHPVHAHLNCIVAEALPGYDGYSRKNGILQSKGE